MPGEVRRPAPSVSGVVAAPLIRRAHGVADVVLPSFPATVDPSVRRALGMIAKSLNQLAAVVRQSSPAHDPAIQSQAARTTRALQSVQQQVTRLAQQVVGLEVATAGLSPVPDDTVTSPSGTIGAGSAMPTVALADLLATVEAYAAAHPIDLADSCVPSGGTWTYMDGLVAALQLVDERVGFNGKRGNTADPSGDAISYYHGLLPPVSGSPNVYVVDVIGGHCGAAPSATWNNVTTSLAAGAWMSTR